MGASFSVLCTVVLPPDARRTPSGELHAIVEDVTLADVRATVVARATHVVTSPAPGRLSPFSLHGELPDPSGRFSLRVTVDLDGDGRIGPGDLLSTQSVPITHGRNEVEVPLTAIAAPDA